MLCTLYNYLPELLPIHTQSHIRPTLTANSSYKRRPLFNAREIISGKHLKKKISYLIWSINNNDKKITEFFSLELD